jgi:hypothetical protein
MNMLLEKHDLLLIVDALENYQLDILHGENNGHTYVWTTDEVGDLIKYLNDILDRISKDGS